jgi:hypothetical protein
MLSGHAAGTELYLLRGDDGHGGLGHLSDRERHNPRKAARRSVTLTPDASGNPGLFRRCSHREVTNGVGMTMSFGFAEQILRESGVAT